MPAWVPILSGCGPADSSANALPNTAANSTRTATGQPIVLRVGEYTFDAHDLDIRQRVIRQKAPASDALDVGAVAQLIRGALILTTLDRLGERIGEAELGSEIQRIEAATREPEKLAELQRLCGGIHSRGYRTIAILPDFANSKFFFQSFARHGEIQAERLALAQTTLQRALATAPDSPDWPALAAGTPGVNFMAGMFSPKTGFQVVASAAPDESAFRPSPAHRTPNPLAHQIETEIFSSLPAHTVCPKLLDLPGGFCIVRWLDWRQIADGEVRESMRRVECLQVPKITPDEFLWQHAATIPVWLADADLRARFGANVDWAAKLKWEKRP